MWTECACMHFRCCGAMGRPCCAVQGTRNMTKRCTWLLGPGDRGIQGVKVQRRTQGRVALTTCEREVVRTWLVEVLHTWFGSLPDREWGLVDNRHATKAKTEVDTSLPCRSWKKRCGRQLTPVWRERQQSVGHVVMLLPLHIVQVTVLLACSVEQVSIEQNLVDKTWAGGDQGSLVSPTTVTQLLYKHCRKSVTPWCLKWNKTGRMWI